MQERADTELLRQYAEQDSEAAFATLVTRHVNLVYSAAVRKTGNPHAAEEITQAVFIILARKARALRKETVLSGWLYQTARLTAANFVRNEIRRVRREQESYMQSLSNETEAWPHIEPLLDDAMGRLNEKERNAIVLRFFERKNFQEIGTAFGGSENAAKKRVIRGLEKLRKFFARRGVSSTTAIIAGAISAHSVQAAPVVLAKAVTAIAITKGVAASGSTLTLIKGAIKIMAWTKAKSAVVVGVGILVATGTTTVTVKEIQDHRVYEWQKRWQGAGIVDKVPPQVAIRPSPPDRNPSVHDWGTSNGKMVGLGYDFTGMVKGIYQIDDEHLQVSAAVPAGKFDWIANLSAPGDNNFSLNFSSLQAAIKKNFGLQIRREHIETNVLFLTLRSRSAPGLKPHPEDWQQGPKITEKSISFQGGTWLLVQALEDSLGSLVVDRTGLSDHYNVNLKWDATPDGLKRVLREQLGMELVPSDEPVAVPMVVIEKAAKPALQTISETVDVQPDGAARFHVNIKQTNRTSGTIAEDYINGMGSDAMNIDGLADESGQPMKFEIQNDSSGGLLIATLNKPVPAGGEFSYTVELTLTNFVQPAAADGEFVCQLTDVPDDECVTHSIEAYRLPRGAVVLSKHPTELKQVVNDGRPELQIERTIPPGSPRELNFRYRLPSGTN